MILTSAQAISLLNTNPDAYITLDSLRALATQVDVSATGKVTVLYSGPIAPGISSTGIINGMLANGEDIRVIDNTEAAKFLKSDAFLAKVADAHGIDLIELQAPTYRGPAADWLYDAKSGPWADASGRFVSATTGEVKTLTPFASPNRTFAQIELPALLENTHVTTVNGVPREALTALYHDLGGAVNSDALLKLQGATGLLSWKATADLDIIKNADGTLLVDAGKFLSDGLSPVAPAFPDDMPGKLSGAAAMGSLAEVNKTALLANIDYLSKIDLAAKGLSKLSTAAAVVDFLLTVNDASAAVQAGDTAKAGSLLAEWTATFGASMSAGLLAGEIVGSALAPLYLTGPLGASVAAVLTIGASVGAAMLAATGAEILISDLVGSSFSSARTVTRDPLILDLDGDGLETIGPAQSNVKFDHNGGGIKTISGWVKPDDGFLVMDRNNNGVIDNGHELFGDATPLYVGGFAADGFAALVQEDTNGDGKVDSTDANWSKLRIWRDLNQDGISQANELFTMSDADIASFNAAKTVNSVRLANGNVVADLGTYIKTDGATGTLSETSRLGDVNLAQDTFHSQFTDAIPIDADAQQLPSVRGSGLVRELRQAASLDTAARNTLKAKLAAFAAAHTGAEQQAALDDLLLAWADTSPLIPYMQDRNPAQIKVVWASAAQQAQWETKLHILEAFNGHYFFALPGESQTGATGITLSAPDSQGVRTATVNLVGGQTNQLQQSFDALKDSVYGPIVLQTRLQPLLDTIHIDLDADGAHLNLDQLNAALKARVADNAINGLTDWIDIAKYAQPILAGAGFDAWSPLETTLRSSAITTDTLNALHVHIAGANGNLLNGGDTDDLLFGGGGNDTLGGGNGNDFYIFHAGDGHDVVYENANAGVDVLQLGAGLDPSNTRINAENLDLVLAFNTGDTVRISNYFGQNRVEQIRFADGTTWDFASVISKPIIGTAGADTLSATGGYAGSINGLEGNDTIYGSSGNDTITGGTGSDSLNGSSGNDT
ncbi:calcium-binding protein, partial [Massilia sp. Root335]|uniref:calcium-binding protein n=1 Tax=Massilia sp. Root335 TaxID=1736517 RepID=UPI0027D88479